MRDKRLLIALVLIPLLYLYVMYLPSYFYLFLITFASTIALIELYAMFRVQGLLRYTGVFWGAVLLFVFFMVPHRFFEALMLAALTIMTVRLFAKRDPGASFAGATAVVFGLIYIPCLMTFQLSLVKAAPAWIVMLYASVWAADSAAYYVGRNLGKRKLYVEMSPNKTVEGAVGSIFGGIAGAGLIKFTILQGVSLPQTILLGAVVGATTIIGDLVESMFKRDAGIKDSGSLLPGHGGILDKIDGVTFAGPAFFWACVGLGLIP